MRRTFTMSALLVVSSSCMFNSDTAKKLAETFSSPSGLTILETMDTKLPRGSAWGKTLLSFGSSRNSDVECKFGPEATFGAASFQALAKVGENYQVTLTKPAGAPETGLYKIQCRGESNDVAVTSDVYEIFFDTKLADDDRCDTAADAPSDEFLFTKAKQHLTASGTFKAGSNLKAFYPRIEFTIPRSQRDTGRDVANDGNHRLGASADKYTGNPGDGFIKDGYDYVADNLGTLRKLVHFDAEKEFFIIRKAWSYAGSCSFWLRKYEGINNPNYPGHPFAYSFNYCAKMKNPNGGCPQSGGLHNVYAVVMNSRGQTVALDQNGNRLHTYESGFGLIQRYLIHGDYRPVTGNPNVSHEWNIARDPDTSDI